MSSFSEQIEPLDLSPLKQSVSKKKENKDESHSMKNNKETFSDQLTDKSKQSMEDITNIDNQFVAENEKSQSVASVEVPTENAEVIDKEYSADVSFIDIQKRRKKYPFDKRDDNECYLSEFEEGDSEEYTNERRKHKNINKRKLREIDDIPRNKYKGDEEIIKEFLKFLRAPTNRGCEEGGFNKIKEVSTFRMYSRAVEVDLLSAFHELFQPFDSRWLLDCTTKKTCLFEGEERRFVSQEEPIYLTSRILTKALEKYDNRKTGGQRATLLAATMRFMSFIELHFNNKLNLYGREPQKKVISYHNGVKSFIEATKTWKSANEDKKQTVQINKVIKEIENPNYEIELLERYKTVIQSPERMSQIKKVLFYSKDCVAKPDEKDITEIGQIVMGEIIASTGKRPVVVYRLTVGAYVGKKPGFNPLKITDGDCRLDEEYNDQKLYRRVNPNLPPKHLACKHQFESKTAKCPLECKDECQPDGFNILVQWDKTGGSSYLHLVKPVKDLMDLYDIIKTKLFQGRVSSQTEKEDWLNDENTPFFLNSSGSPFKTISLKHLSETMKIDVTSYSFRRIVSTWAQSHKDEEIRKSEEE